MTNGAQPKFTGKQAAVLMTLDMVCVVLQTAANQLGGFLELQAEGNILVRALAQVSQDKERLVADWRRSVVLAAPAALSVIDGKKVG